MKTIVNLNEEEAAGLQTVTKQSDVGEALRIEVRACVARLPLLAVLIGGVLSLCTIGLAQAQGVDANAPPAKVPGTKETAVPQSGPPGVSAKAWAIADGKTGKVLWGHNEAEPRAIASTTKIMTAFLVFRLTQDDPKVLDEELVFSERAAAVPGSSSHLRAGERLPVRELMYGMLLPSGNDAAVAVAEHFGPRFKTGGQKENDPVRLFIAEMNRRAKELKLAHTSFLDPNGLARNQASARDMALLTWTAMQNKLFREYVSTRKHSYSVVGKDGQTRKVTWTNTNKLLGEKGYDGVKTGTTRAAGACLVASGTSRGDRLIVVVLGASPSDARYTDARALFQWAWRQRAAGTLDSRGRTKTGT